MANRPLLGKLLKAIILPGLFVLGVPLGLGMLQDTASLPRMAAFIPTVLALEYFAIPVGLSLGLSPLLVLATVIAEGIGMFVATVEALETLGKLWWLSGLVSRVQKRTSQSRLLRKYGVYALALSVIYLSVKGCAALVWLMGWPKGRALVLTMLGLAVISTVVLLSTWAMLKGLGALFGG